MGRIRQIIFRVAGLTALLIFHVMGSASAQEAVTGKAVALSTDRLAVDGNQFFLFGIHSFEEAQVCFINGQQWACGAVAYRELQILVDEGPVTCARRTDRNPRRMRFPWATCTVGGVDIAESMVRAGYAFVVRDQSEEYLPAQAEAEAAGVGGWQGLFEPPWAYRDRLRGL
jgi:endonuclease YncB( thermonuclease family)